MCANSNIPISNPGMELTQGQARPEKKHAVFFLFIFFTCLYLLTAGGHFYNQDGYLKYLTLDQIVKGEGPFHPRFFTPGLDGRSTTSFPPGTSFWMLPLYAGGKACTVLVLHWKPAAAINPDLFFAPLFVTFLNVFFSAGLCALFFSMLCRMGLAFRAALGAAVCLGLGTFLWPYSKFCYSEPQAAFFLWAAFMALYALKQRGGHPGMAILWLGCAFLTKYETIFLWPAFGGYGFFCLQKCRRANPKGFIFFTALPLILTAALFITWNYVRTGHAWTFGRYGGYLFSNLWGWGAAGAVVISGVFYLLKRPAAGDRRREIKFIFMAAAGLAAYLLAVPPARSEVIALLWAPGKSLFVFSPPLLLAVAGYRDFLKTFRAEGLLVAAFVVSYLLFLPPTIQSAAWQWGSRFWVSLTPFLFLPALPALLENQNRLRKNWLGLLFGVSFCAQVISVSISYQDTFNYTAQKISADFRQPVEDFEIERKIVFPRMIYDWRYAPLWMQSKILQSVLGWKELPTLPEPLAFKSRVKSPQEWKLDFWWIYLWNWPGGAWAVRLSFLLIVSGAAASLARLLR